MAILTKAGQSNLEERIQGYQDEFAENWPDVELVQIINDDSDSAKAAEGLKAVLAREPELKGVGCVEAAGGVGAATAVKELGLEGEFKIVSMDRDDGTLKFIEDGVIEASVAQKTALMTYLGTKLLYYLNHAPVPVVPDNVVGRDRSHARIGRHGRYRDRQGQRRLLLSRVAAKSLSRFFNNRLIRQVNANVAAKSLSRLWDASRIPRLRLLEP